MALNTRSKTVKFPAIHYICVEKKGPFQKTAPSCWAKLKKTVPTIAKTRKIKDFLSLYQIEPRMVYRAGVAVGKKPASLPRGFKYVKFKGGKYARFLLKGSYMQLPEACGKVFELVEKRKMKVRADWFIEHYLNDPDTTPEANLLTAILIPIR